MFGMVILFFALGTGVTITVSAGLAFLGFMNPFIPTWGIMLQNAYGSTTISRIWFWIFPPGFMISLTVLFIVMLGRGYDRGQEAQMT